MLYLDASVDSPKRRSFLRHSLYVSALTFCGKNTLASVERDDAAKHPLHAQDKIRTLKLANDGTGEILEVVYWRNNQYIADNVGQLNYFMRDFHVGKSYLMDPKLYDFLYALQLQLDKTEIMHILSAYRTPDTNSKLRNQSVETAVRSFHTKGRAVDFYIPGLDLNHVQKTARKLVMGGVGYYPNSGFVHIDTGPPRSWKVA